MIRSLALFTALLLASAVAAAPVPKSVKKNGDEAQLEGRWAIVIRDLGSGHSPQINDGGTFTLVIQDGLLSAGSENQKWFVNRPFSLDSTKSPKHLDIQMKREADRPTIYELDGDTLTWCFPYPDLPRPTAFQEADDRPCYVLKRVTDEKNGK